LDTQRIGYNNDITV